MAAAGACTKVAAVRGLSLTLLPPLPMQFDVESWAPAESGTGNVAGGCTKVAQSVAQLLPLSLPPPSLPSTPRATAGGWSPTAPATSKPPATKRRCSSAAASTAAENCTGSSMRCPKLEPRPYWLRTFRRACFTCAVYATGTEGARAHSMQLTPLLLQLLPLLPLLKLHNAELWAPARGGAVTAPGWALLQKPMPPLPLQHDAESWEHTDGGAVTATEGCTKVAQSVALLLKPLPPLP